MKCSAILISFVVIALCVGCGSSSSSGDGDGGGGGNNVESGAADYAKFGEILNSAIPAGLKTGGVSADISADIAKALSGQCAADYTDCPYMTASGGGDSTTGEILMRLWGMDYDSECTAALLASGECFHCADCNESGTDFIMPTMLASPTSCASTSTTAGHYVNFGMDPCFFDTMIGQISNIDDCATIAGGAVDISSAVPWFASWGIPQTVDFSSYYAGGDSGIWWTVNEGSSGNQQYFLSLSSNWLYAGIKDASADQFMFFGSGSPAYYSGRGEGSGVNISAYAGTLSAVPARFQAIQVRDQAPNTYIERMISNGTYVWYQSWSGSDFPATPAAVASVKDSPSMNRCVKIGTSVATSKYVPLAECVSSFGKASVAALNLDDNFALKIIDGQTAGAISFTTPLTATTASSCLPVAQ